ncbi:DUF2505 domain-containing protein [Phycicoccus flavus]|uniref:DUF2505 domain-containing protein n=1 Tax=Phycicoccus flavus TaxID=2502783 RepID=UPI000FEC1F96|nr:DUF2505 domain-containing protein [Phycicoccus flavus]NHA69526.1 DUF2505 domain-containing protein [Phycicoccus flavus]
MRLTRRERLDASPDAVYALLTDEDFQREKCARTSEGGTYDVSVTPTGVGHRVQTSRQMSSSGLPDAARSFVGDTLVVVESYDWGAPGPDGSREAAVDLHVKGAPLVLRGTLRVEADGTGSLEVLDAELKANIPFIGGKIEQSASGPIYAAVDTEVAMLRDRLG